MRWPPSPALLALLVAALLCLLAAPGAVASACKPRKTDWRPVALDVPAPEGIVVEWRADRGPALGECIDELWLRVTNGGKERQRVELGACRVDGTRVAEPSFTVPPGETRRAIVASLEVPSIAEVRCAGARAMKRAGAAAAAAKPPRGEQPLPLHLLLPAPPGDAAHLRQLSREIVVHFLDDAFRYQAAVPLPLADRIQRALMRATDLREQPGNSTILQLRNAEYYLHGLYAEVSGDPVHIANTRLREVYDLLKGAAQGTPLEKLMRANPDNPTSPPGGAEWAAAGLRDGAALANEPVAGRPDGHGLALTELFR